MPPRRDDLSINGADRFRALARELRRAGRGDLLKELQKELREAIKPVTTASRQEATRRLPQAGGLARRVARSPQLVTARAGATTASVRLTVAGRRSAAAAADQGTVRHPVFGRKQFVNQQVPKGWFTDTVDREQPQIVRKVERTLDDFTARIARGV